MWAIVPLKALDTAKRRLADVLTPDERRTLMLAMARDVLTALARCRALSGVLIVSRTPEADALAQTFATERFMESPEADLSAALRQAAEFLAEHRGARGVMIVPADVPLIDAGDIEEILAGHESVTIMPDDEHLGTNGLICTPPTCMEFIFDGRSFRPHLEAAARAGARPRVVPSPRFALDVDVPDDLRTLLARGPGTQTAIFLQRAGIAARLGGLSEAGGKVPEGRTTEFRSDPASDGRLDGRTPDPHNGRLNSGS